MRDRKRTERASVEGVLQREEFRFLAVELPVGGQPRQLERPFDGFGAAVGEEYAVHPGPFRELASQRALVGIVK